MDLLGYNKAPSARSWGGGLNNESPIDGRIAVLRSKVDPITLLRGDEQAVEAQLGARLTAWDLEVLSYWRRAVRRRVEDLIRKDNSALATCVMALLNR